MRSTLIRSITGVALAAALALPLTASAQPAPIRHAVCTQVEPTEGRMGISYYDGTAFCTLLAANPFMFGWPTVPFDPAPNGMHGVCQFSITGNEYAVVWSQVGYEYQAALYCDGLRRDGMQIVFVTSVYR
jgi:hypothetical protein